MFLQHALFCHVRHCSLLFIPTEESLVLDVKIFSLKTCYLYLFVLKNINIYKHRFSESHMDNGVYVITKS